MVYETFSDPEVISESIGMAILRLGELSSVMSRLEYIASGGSRPDDGTWTLRGVELLAQQGMQSGVYTEAGRAPLSDESTGDEYGYNAGDYESRDREMVGPAKFNDVVMPAQAGIHGALASADWIPRLRAE